MFASWTAGVQNGCVCPKRPSELRSSPPRPLEPRLSNLSWDGGAKKKEHQDAKHRRSKQRREIQSTRLGNKRRGRSNKTGGKEQRRDAKNVGSKERRRGENIGSKERRRGEKHFDSKSDMGMQSMCATSNEARMRSTQAAKSNAGMQSTQAAKNDAGRWTQGNLCPSKIGQGAFEGKPFSTRLFFL